MIDKFAGKYAFLSNYYPSDIVKGEITFPTVEHFFQAMKTKHLEERLMIAGCPTPGEAKKMGRRVMLRDDWEEVKVGIMDYGVKQKFMQNEELRQMLKDTYPHELIEGNYWHDNFWGRCNCKKCAGKGKNILGQILMNSRNII